MWKGIIKQIGNMTVDLNALVNSFRQIFRPIVRENRTTQSDDKIKEIAPERIKRSPGHQNLAELTDEPEWYHD